MEELGCVHLYYGNGKGKTTCAMGLALRFSYYGQKVVVIQCLKDGSSGEIQQLKQFDNISIWAEKVSANFSWAMTQEEKEATRDLMKRYFTNILEESWDLLVVDEVCAGLTSGFVTEDQVKGLLEARKEHQELVFTGRNPPDFLKEVAHYVTHFQEEKHPYHEGISAREGIEY